jgi:hypothetical protein
MHPRAPPGRQDYESHNVVLPPAMDICGPDDKSPCRRARAKILTADVADTMACDTPCIILRTQHNTDYRKLKAVCCKWFNGKRILTTGNSREGAMGVNWRETAKNGGKRG